MTLEQLIAEIRAGREVSRGRIQLAIQEEKRQRALAGQPTSGAWLNAITETLSAAKRAAETIASANTQAPNLERRLADTQRVERQTQAEAAARAKRTAYRGAAARRARDLAGRADGKGG